VVRPSKTTVVAVAVGNNAAAVAVGNNAAAVAVGKRRSSVSTSSSSKRKTGSCFPKCSFVLVRRFRHDIQSYPGAIEQHPRHVQRRLFQKLQLRSSSEISCDRCPEIR